MYDGDAVERTLLIIHHRREEVEGSAGMLCAYPMVACGELQTRRQCVGGVVRLSSGVERRRERAGSSPSSLIRAPPPSAPIAPIVLIVPSRRKGSQYPKPSLHLKPTYLFNYQISDSPM
jgi:hypothetical protein